MQQGGWQLLLVSVVAAASTTYCYLVLFCPLSFPLPQIECEAPGCRHSLLLVGVEGTQHRGMFSPAALLLPVVEKLLGLCCYVEP